MSTHVANSGKRVVNTEHHTIPTNLKTKTVLTDEYLKEIEGNSDQRYFFLRAKCCHSFKKSEAPHVLRFFYALFQAKSSMAKWGSVTMALH